MFFQIGVVLLYKICKLQEKTLIKILDWEMFKS
jgi:hypothetical protein